MYSSLFVCLFIDINDCEADSCKNGATCVDGINEFSCQCLEGYEGKACEISKKAIICSVLICN